MKVLKSVSSLLKPPSNGSNMSVTIGVSIGVSGDGCESTELRSLSDPDDDESKSNGDTSGRSYELHWSFKILSSSASMFSKYKPEATFGGSRSIRSSDSNGRRSEFEMRVWLSPLFGLRLKMLLFGCTVFAFCAEFSERAIGLLSFLTVKSSFGCLISFVDGMEPLS